MAEIYDPFTGYWRTNLQTGVYDWIEQPLTLPAPTAPKEEKIHSMFEAEEPKVEMPVFSIKELAASYQISPALFISAEQLKQLALPPEERTLAWEVPHEQYLTWEQARYIGLKVPEGAVVKMIPSAEGEPAFYLMEKPPSISAELTNALRYIYPEMFAPSAPATELLFPQYAYKQTSELAIEQIYNRMQVDYQGFVDDLYERAGEGEAENLLRQLGVTEEFILLALDHEKQEERVLDNIQAIFPEFDNIDDFSTFLEGQSELFFEEIKASDAPSDVKRNLLADMGIPADQIESLIREPITITEAAHENLETSWEKLTTGEFNWGEVGQVALGALGIAGSYMEKYIGRPWETLILEARSRFQKLVGWNTELDDIALRRLEDTRNKYGWAAALISEDISDIWEGYIEGSNRAVFPLRFVEWCNPAYLVPIGGTFGVATKFTTKIPLIGRVTKLTAAGVNYMEGPLLYMKQPSLVSRAMRKLAKGVGAVEKGAAYPITKPAELGIKWGAKGAQQVGERIGKSLADKIIKQSKNLETLLELPTMERDIAEAISDNWQRRVLQAAAKVPPIKAGVEKTLGWRILIKQESQAVGDIVGRGVVGRTVMLKRGVDAANLKVWELQEISRNPAKLFGFDKNAYSSKLGGNLEEIFTRPKNFNLNPEQTAYIARFNEVNTLVLNLLKLEGVPPEHLIEDWVHRVVLTEGQMRKVSRRIGAKPSYEKVRKFETMVDGIKYFIEHPELKSFYANNPELLIRDYIQQAFKTIGDERFVKYVAREMEAAGKTFGVKPTEKLIQFPELFEEITSQAGRELAEKAVLRTEELSAAKQFSSVINRALRGEKPHSSTLAMLERKFPEIGKRFREAIGNKEALKTIKGEVKEITEARKLPFWEAKTERAFRMSQLRQPTLKQGYIMEPFAGGKLYDREFIDAFNKFYGHEAGLPGLDIVADTAGILRLTKASLDFSFQAIQGLPSWGLAHAYMLKNPREGMRLLGSWYKAYLESIAAFFRPEVLAKALFKERDIGMQLVSYQGSVRAIDYFEVLSARKGLGGAFEKIAKKIPLTPYERAETAFFGAGQLVRQRFAKILMPKALVKGEEFQLTRFLDRITGITDSATLGVPLTTRQLEQSFVWFAPNYTRACLTVLSDIFRGGMTGAMAREALGGMVAAGSAMYSGIQFAMSSLEGKSEEEAWRDVQEGFGVVTDPITGEVNWQPTGRFMTIKIGNYNIGFGGFWYGLLRLTGNIVACINEVGDRERVDLVRIMKNGTFNKQDNPFIYWWFTRAAPSFGVGYELATGKDFLGYPLETGADYARYIATRFEPIWMEQGINWMIPGMARDNEIPEGIAKQAIAPAELLGLRTFPESQWVKFYDKANELIKHIPRDEITPEQMEAWKKGTLTWKQLTDMQKFHPERGLFSRYPELEELYTKAQADSAIRQGLDWKAWEGDMDRTRELHYEGIDKLDERLRNGEIDTYEYIQQGNDVMSNYGAVMDDIELRHPNIYSYFDEKESVGEKYGIRQQQAIDEYYAEIYTFDFTDDETGIYDWDKRDKRTDEFIEKYGEAMYNDIRALISEKKHEKGLSELWIRKAEDFEALGKDFWRLPYKPIAEMDEEDDIPAEYFALWKQYQALKTDESKSDFIEAHPEFGKDWRGEWRKEHPEDDARLALWGYGGKIQSMEAYDLVTKWGQELGIPLEQMGLGLPPRSVAPLYFEHNDIIRDTSPNSVQSRLYKLTTGKKLLEWNLEQGIWTDDLSGESIEALKLRDKYRDLIAEREAWGNKLSESYIPPNETITVDGREVNKRQWTYDNQYARNPQFKEAMRTVDIYELSKRTPDAFGNLIPEDIITEYLPYMEIVDKFGAASSQAKLYRYESEHLNEFGLKTSTFSWEELDESKVSIWKIDVNYTEQDAEYQFILDNYEGKEQTERTSAYLYDTEGNPTEYCLKRYEREALRIDFPEKQIEDYVDWYTNPTLKKPVDWPDSLEFYEDDWYLMAHSDFHQALVDSGIFKKLKNFDLVPTRDVFKQYVGYRSLPTGTRRVDYRWDLWSSGFTEFEEWMLLTGKITQHIKEKKRREGLTPLERGKEEVEEEAEEREEQLEEIRKILERLGR